MKLIQFAIQCFLFGCCLGSACFGQPLVFTHCEIVKVTDGDTIQVMVSLGLEDFTKIRVRVAVSKTIQFDAPESTKAKAKSADELRRGLLAKERAKELLPVGAIVKIETYKPTADIYARYAAAVTMADGRNFATVMIAEGHVK